MSKFLIIDKAKNILEFDAEVNQYETVSEIISNNLSKVKRHSSKKELFKSIGEYLKK